MAKQSPRVVEATAPGRSGKAPWWRKKANRLVVALQRAGLVIGPVHLPSTPGRKSGKMRTTPMSPLVVGDRRIPDGPENLMVSPVLISGSRH